MSLKSKIIGGFSLVTVTVATLLLFSATLAKKSQNRNFGVELVSERKIKVSDFEPHIADSEFRTWLGMSWDGPSLHNASDEWIKFEGRKKTMATIIMLPGDKYAVACGTDDAVYLLQIELKPKVVASANLKVAARKIDLVPTIVATKNGFYALTFDGYIESWSVTPQGLKFLSEQKITAGDKNITFEGNANGKLAWIEESSGTQEVCVRDKPKSATTRIKPPAKESIARLYVSEDGKIFYFTNTECWMWQSTNWISLAKFPDEQFVFVTTKKNRAAIWQVDDLYIIDTDTGKRLAHLRVRFADPVQFSPDAKEIVVGTFGSLQRYRLTTR